MRNWGPRYGSINTVEGSHTVDLLLCGCTCLSIVWLCSVHSLQHASIELSPARRRAILRSCPFQPMLAVTRMVNATKPCIVALVSCTAYCARLLSSPTCLLSPPPPLLLTSPLPPPPCPPLKTPHPHANKYTPPPSYTVPPANTYKS